MILKGIKRTLWGVKMNKNNIFKGDCYLCPKDSKKKFITRVDSWVGQRVGDVFIPGSYRAFCNSHVKSMGWLPNREPNKCLSCKGGFIGSKEKVICLKCRGVKNGR